MWSVIKNHPKVVLLLISEPERNRSAEILAKTGMIYSDLSGNTPIYEATCCQKYPESLMGWWALTGSNRRHSACKADALPTELSAPIIQVEL